MDSRLNPLTSPLDLAVSPAVPQAEPSLSVAAQEWPTLSIRVIATSRRSPPSPWNQAVLWSLVGHALLVSLLLLWDVRRGTGGDQHEHLSTVLQGGFTAGATQTSQSPSRVAELLLASAGIQQTPETAVTQAATSKLPATHQPHTITSPEDRDPLRAFYTPRPPREMFPQHAVSHAAQPFPPEARREPPTRHHVTPIETLLPEFNGQSAAETGSARMLTLLSGTTELSGTTATSDPGGLRPAGNPSGREMPQRAGSAAGTTSFFGISARTARVVYVLDGSESMLTRRAFDRAQQELLASVAQLPSRVEFQVILFNETPAWLLGDGRDRRLVPATPRNAAQLERTLRGAIPAAGSNRRAALLAALEAKPDTIYLLSDCSEPRMTRQDLEHVQRANTRGCVIHVVEFRTVPTEEDNFLQRLAADHQGEFRVEDLTQ